MMLKYDLIIARYGELGLKSPKVRSRFEKKLLSNIKSAFDCEVRVSQGRIFIKPYNFKEALQGLRKIFGIVSFSPAIALKTDREEITSKLEGYVDQLEDEGTISSETSFAIRCRRVGEHEFTSQELAGYAGSVVIKKTNSPVDLTNPELEISLEVRDNETFIYHQKISGPGGLPVGTQGKLVALLSGGIDSPVATYLMMKRGCQIIALNFNNDPFTSNVALEKVQKMVEKIREYSPGVKLDLKIVEYGEYLQNCKVKAPEKMTCVLCKTGMYRIAETVARREGAMGIVDGSSMGQVASQTLPNLMVTQQSVKLPILSPLIGMDKVEIENMAKDIGTYDISIIPDGGCSAVPRYPETNADLERVMDAQESMDMDGELKNALKSLKKI
ncbi:MAG: tRNA 4-thiouridine(8) synthase ThiI [Euryarchaeota archaeon]|nr:tRNA 4-thiouridine(8) synthase ThiI [Euryarchaeota archaeon]MBU4607158.1 tRNA 4-thiouridine(8) synthase ThiI [Euryarchaeota archaeon]MBV1729774.1 tRNA 4-thiouridine(8) synthase ThiI [Methanobacterium sp.]MBV1755743.1 tRNA 4-thiouridine(8) synthase ThiI [Methanobacterium sp.]